MFIWTESARISRFTMVPQSLRWLSGANLEGITSYKQDIKASCRDLWDAKVTHMWAVWSQSISALSLSDACVRGEIPPHTDTHALLPALNQSQQHLQKCSYSRIHVEIRLIRAIRYSYVQQKTTGCVRARDGIQKKLRQNPLYRFNCSRWER